MAIKIFIDQGHNPENVNAGAEGNGLREQDITYNVGIYLRDMLNNDYRFDAITSRNTPTEILGFNNTSSLSERVRKANEWGADYFISIHANAAENPAFNGSEIFVYNQGTPIYYMAEDILEEITEQLGTKDNGVKINKTLYVLRRTQMPAMLIELAFITNPADAEKLRNNQYQFANAIYDGILDFFDIVRRLLLLSGIDRRSEHGFELDCVIKLLLRLIF
jgi:N-acetylmuramoyl-L-alanine amidase